MSTWWGARRFLKPLTLRKAGRSLGHPADRVELVSRDAGFFSVEDAWHFLATRGGCGRIDLAVAEPRDRGGLTPFKPASKIVRVEKIIEGGDQGSVDPCPLPHTPPPNPLSFLAGKPGPLALSLPSHADLLQATSRKTPGPYGPCRSRC